jgi:hypothetical protein
MKKIILFSLIGISSTLFGQEVDPNVKLLHLEKLFETIKVFPNPTSEILFIRSGELVDSYQLVDINGQVVQSGKNEVQVISLIDHPEGTYFLFLEIEGLFRRYRVVKY